MKRLHLLRHAKSTWDEPEREDRQRPLAPRGRRAATAMGRHMAGLGVRPERVLCSSARRTVETLERVLAAGVASGPIAREDALYLAPAPALLERLRALDDAAGSALLVGHNPGLADLAVLLLGDADAAARRRVARKLPTGAWLELELPLDAWAELHAGSARLRRFVRPKELDR